MIEEKAQKQAFPGQCPERLCFASAQRNGI
jgi:hypothetical protein